MLFDWLQTALAFAAFALFFLAPGYLVSLLTNVMQFRAKSFAERILWSVGLSGALSIAISCILGRLLPTKATLGLFLAIGIASAVLLVLDFIRSRRQSTLGFGREFRWVCLAMAVIAAYVILASSSIQTSSHLYEGVASTDLSIRIPLVEAGARGAVPPGNPLFALHGHAVPMRYYYFWYVLCGDLVKLTGISARGTFAASSIWAAYSVIAVLFLILKYLVPRNSLAPLWQGEENTVLSPSTLRRQCLVALGLACVMGLDVFAAIFGLFMHRVRLYPDIEFWRTDRMPSWEGVIICAPHHAAGIAFGGMGFLLLALLPEHRRQRILHGLLSAVCFAALAGTSTYLALCFAFVGILMLLVELRLRQWNKILMLAICGALALLLTLPFLHDMASHTGYTASSHDASMAPSLLANQVFKVVLRNWHSAFGFMGYTTQHLFGWPKVLRPYVSYPLACISLVIFYVMELSYFLLVIRFKAKADLIDRKHTSDAAWMLWCLFLGIALPALLLSSEPTQRINDLGRVAGAALRLPLLLWATPLVANAIPLLRSRRTATRTGRWIIRLTTLAFIAGLAGQVWQITLDRIYVPLTEHGIVVNNRLYFPHPPFLNVRRANYAIDKALPADAIIQSNPEGNYQSLFLLYTTRQMAAGDLGCDASFGGDVDVCKQQISYPLHSLYGGFLGRHRKFPGVVQLPPADPSLMTPAHFEQTCKDLHLSALLASKRDPTWEVTGSWVWTEPVLYADKKVRVLTCPR